MADSIPSRLQQHEPEPGDYIGHYRITQLLARGGMGVVYKAFEATLNRHVAIKLLSPTLAADQEFVQRFLHEAQVVANLHHPNIIHIYYIGQHGDLLYFAMELVEGADLETLLRQQQQFSVREAVGFIYQAALALQYAHKHNLLHRDIKPSNLMVAPDGVVKVTDFGLAHNVKADHTGMSMSILGTPDYLSPEEIRGQTVDHRSDMYSLGATLYHLLAGRPPFSGTTQEEILQHHLRSQPLPIRQFNMKAPPTLQQGL